MEQNQQKLDQSTNNVLFSGQVPVVFTQAPEFFVQVSPSVMRSGLLVEGEQLLSSLAIFWGLPLISSHTLPAR